MPFPFQLAFFSAPFFPALGGWFGTALVGAGLASVPIVIHLLNRRRFRERQWAAMQFLLAALKKNARRLRLEQLLLLAVRVLLLLVLVAAMAKPYLEHAGLVIRSGERYHKVLVLDASFSMGYQPGQRSRFERAKDVAVQIIEESKKGDAISVVLLSSPPRVVVGQPSYDRAEVLEEIEELELTDGGADLPATLARVEEVLNRGRDVLQGDVLKEVYFLTDLQRTCWLPAELAAGDRGEFRKRAMRLDEQATLVVVDLGQRDSANVALTELKVRDPYVTAGRPAVLTAVVQNLGREPVLGLNVELLVQGQVEDNERVDLDPGGGTSITFSPVFPAPGDHAVELRLAGDALPIDDRRWLALPVEEHVNVLCVNGRPAGDYFDQATSYLETALAPPSSTAASLSAVRPVVVPESQWWNEDLAQYSCLFFCNVGQFTQSEYERLEGYVQQGGAVVWFLGNQVRSEIYNRIMYRDGEGLLPVRLGALVGDPQQQQQTFRFDPLGYQHPIVEPFRDQLDAGLVTAQVYAYLRAELPAESTARTALAFEGGDPAIVEQQWGRGTAILVTTASDRSWGAWPMSSSFVPVVHEILRFAIADRMSERSTLVGRSVRFPIPDARIVRVSVERPDGRSDTVDVGADGTFQYPDSDGGVHTGALDTSGIYRIAPSEGASTSGDNALFAVNVDPGESDLAKLERDELEGQVWPGVEFAYLTSWQDLDAETQGPVRHGGELHRLFIYLLLCLLFVELYLAWKFGHYAA